MGEARVSRRKSTVREALALALKARTRVTKLRGRYLFRAAVRRVIEYLDWISLESAESIPTNIANAKLARREKTDSLLTNKDRSILLIPPHLRTQEDINYIQWIMANVKAFKKYPEMIRMVLAGELTYQYVPANRLITRQGHNPWYLYQVVQGELQILQDVTENLTGEVKQIEAGNLVAGDMFGEIALLHKVPRTASVVSKTAVDLFLVSRRSFSDNLKNYLMDEWDVLRDAFENFNYFKGWNDETMRECCIISKIVEYNPNEVLLGDGKGMVHYVYFVLSGECKVIEHMMVQKEVTHNKHVKYKLYNPQRSIKSPSKSQRTNRSRKFDQYSNDELESLMLKSISRVTKSEGQPVDDKSTVDELIRLVSTKKDNANVAMARISVITVTLQDVLNQWHEISEAVEMLMKKPSVNSLTEFPNNVETVFMQICIYYRGACFGLGERMKNRRIIALTPVKCLLVPRFWLTQHNRANVWERVKQFLDSKFPSNEQLLDKYLKDKIWTKYKKNYIEDLLKRGRDIPNHTKPYDVPYSIRINENEE